MKTTATEAQLDKMNAGSNGRQKCKRCNRRSLPGLIKGEGRCAYHFSVDMYGAQWADHCAETQF